MNLEYIYSKNLQILLPARVPRRLSEAVTAYSDESRKGLSCPEFPTQCSLIRLNTYYFSPCQRLYFFSVTEIIVFSGKSFICFLIDVICSVGAPFNRFWAKALSLLVVSSPPIHPGVTDAIADCE